MRYSASFLLVALLLPIRVMAQKPFLAVVTSPTSQTIKLPPLNLCLLSNGKVRPFPCEFRFDKLEFIGNDGTVLGTVKPVKGQPAPTLLSFKKAKKSAPAGQTGPITYTVKAYFTRLNKPSFPVSKGYQIRTCLVTGCLQTDQISTVLSGLVMPANMGKQTVLTFDLSWLYGKDFGGMGPGPHELYIQNDVTATKFSSSANVRDRSEAWIVINPQVTSAALLTK